MSTKDKHNPQPHKPDLPANDVRRQPPANPFPPRPARTDSGDTASPVPLPGAVPITRFGN